MSFHLKVYDNFHYGDESEAYDHGHFNTYEEAVAGAKAIVDEFLEFNWKPGVTADHLIGQYCLYGEDPVIFPNEPGELEPFSGRRYANEVAEEICRKLENKG